MIGMALAALRGEQFGAEDGDDDMDQEDEGEDLSLEELRELLTEWTIVIDDTFHMGAHLSKMIWARFRSFVMKVLWRHVYGPRVTAYPNRRLATMRTSFYLLRRATTAELLRALKEWEREGAEKGFVDPRCAALSALLTHYLPLVALWERVSKHGPLDDMVNLMPEMMMVRHIAASLCASDCGIRMYVQAFEQLESPSYAKNLATAFCNFVDIRQRHPQVYALLAEHVYAASSEPEETAHSILAAARGNNIAFPLVRREWRALGPSMRRNAFMHRFFRCASLPPACRPRAALTSARRRHKPLVRRARRGAPTKVEAATAALQQIVSGCREREWTFSGKGTTTSFRDSVLGELTAACFMPDLADAGKVFLTRLGEASRERCAVVKTFATKLRRGAGDTGVLASEEEKEEGGEEEEEAADAADAPPRRPPPPPPAHGGGDGRPPGGGGGRPPGGGGGGGPPGRGGGGGPPGGGGGGGGRGGGRPPGGDGRPPGGGRGGGGGGGPAGVDPLETRPQEADWVPADDYLFELMLPQAAAFGIQRLRVKNKLGDGHCLFRCAVHGDEGDELQNAKAARIAIVDLYKDFLGHDKDAMETLQTSLNIDGIYSSVSEFLGALRSGTRPRTSGRHVEHGDANLFRHFAQYRGRAVLVFKATEKRQLEWVNSCGEEYHERGRPPLCLLWRQAGTELLNHYSVLQPE